MSKSSARRYKGFLITNKKNIGYDICQETETGINIIGEGKTITDCQWEITKILATDEERDLIKEFESMENYQRNYIFMNLFCKEQDEGLNHKEKRLYDLIAIINMRKRQGKYKSSYWPK